MQSEDRMRSSYELREEIDYGGTKYFLQTSFLPGKGHIESSFFKNGVLFDTSIREIEGKMPQDALKELSREVHLDNKRKFVFLLDVAHRIREVVHPKPHLRLAQALFNRNLYAEAIREAQQAVVKGDKSSLPLIVIGGSYYRMGEYRKAFSALEEGVKLDPEYPDLHNLIGQIHLVEKQCGQAIESFNRAIALNVYYGEPYFNLARAYLLNTIVKEDYELSKGLNEKFMRNIEKAAQLNPFLQGERFEEAKRLFKEKRYQETLEMLDNIKETTKQDGVRDIFLELYLSVIFDGESLTERDIEKFLDRVNRIIDQNPSYADGYNSLGVLYTAKCKIFMDRANEAFAKALEINSKYKKAKKNLRLAENDRQGIFILLKALLD
jgi:tetratricopeptide (TPR) repeat protein